MKKLLAILCFLVAFSLVAPHAFAQDASTTAAMPGKSTKGSKSSGVKKTSGRADSELADLSTKLTLTDDQKAKIKPILDDQTAKIHQVKMSKVGTSDDQKAKTKQIREDAATKIRALLTPDQQKLYDGEKHQKKTTPPAA
jgi:Spy/CpxP family protein refolding chaperone